MNCGCRESGCPHEDLPKESLSELLEKQRLMNIGRAREHEEFIHPLHGMKMKFIVVKKEDLESSHPEVKTQFLHALGYIQRKRESEGKKENTYIMINTDEPFIAEIVEILKRNGHWG